MTGVAQTTGAVPARFRPSMRFSARDVVRVAIFAVLMIVVTYAIWPS